MKLQIAVDVNDEEKVLEIADEVHDIVDIFEVRWEQISLRYLRFRIMQL